jgi:hypothetical protein
MTEQEIKAKYGTLSNAARSLGLPKQTLIDRVRRGEDVTGRGGPKPAQSPPAGRPLTEFRNTYDKATIVPAKINAAIAALGSSWDYEQAFAKLAGVSLSDLGNFREAFTDHVVVLGRDGRRAWAGTKKTAQAMREML